ncbi:actin-crosslinking protein [Sodiomyces alkalinus F11]|uniref:Actin-crosslinking protein n=1 Tax=Sodiomyces alkalinus (strain CBS 110278 / VKM F-3762 / F11) TaxID=1314773 RepID=A0A3N2Q6J6_SODAK|nr:actin-crosslinking protein [Sodiomyces alkalinus F11]ROT42327.1 actin-crosslinking protein [Sodiomyces alkalinus F11]
MVKPLTFKGDKKTKKRKRPAANVDAAPSSAALPPTSSTGGGLAAARQEPDDDDSWVSAEVVTDIVGPIMIVLPTETPSALASDSRGKVFTLPIENIVDGNPETAEPHDVRQVWVANKVAGTDQFRLKGHHGKFLSCDKEGVLSASSEAVTALESFNIFRTPDTPGTFQVQTLRDTFFGIREAPAAARTSPAEVVGDADGISFHTTFRIRMQARFKPKLKMAKEEKAKEKITRKELEEAAGRKLEDDEVKRLKKARREGDYHEQLLMVRIKGKHDKFG